MIIRERNPPLGIILLSIAGGLALVGITVGVVQSSKGSKAKKKEVAPAPTPTPTPTPKPAPTPTPTPKPPSYDYKEARRRLNALGYSIKVDNSPISGAEEGTVYGFQTDWNAILDYAFAPPIMKGKSKLVVDGKSGPAVMSALGTAMSVQSAGRPWRQFAAEADAALG